MNSYGLLTLQLSSYPNGGDISVQNGREGPTKG